MPQKRVIEQKDVLLIREKEEEFTAEFGNIRNFFDEKTEKTRKQILLRNIKNCNGSILVDKQWFMNDSLIKLGKKNMGKRVSFNSYCRIYVYKNVNELEQIFVFQKVNQVFLT